MQTGSFANRLACTMEILRTRESSLHGVAYLPRRGINVHLNETIGQKSCRLGSCNCDIVVVVVPAGILFVSMVRQNSTMSVVTLEDSSMHWRVLIIALYSLSLKEIKIRKISDAV